MIQVISFACEDCGHIHTAGEGHYHVEKLTCTALGIPGSMKLCWQRQLIAENHLKTMGQHKLDKLWSLVDAWYDDSMFRIRQEHSENAGDSYAVYRVLTNKLIGFGRTF